MSKEKTLEERLSAPMDYKWRLQSIKGNRATMVAYVDSRQVQDRLDEVFGVLGWKDEYREIGGNLFCGISVYTPEGGWVTKWDVGTESNVEKEKGNSSDSFKRSAVKLGVGRFLYSLDIITLNTAEHTNGKRYPATSSGKILWSPKELTDYCRGLTEKGISDDTRVNYNTSKTSVKTDTAKPWLNKSDTENYSKVVEALKGGFTMADVRKKWSVSKATEKELLASVN